MNDYPCCDLVQSAGHAYLQACEAEAAYAASQGSPLTKRSCQSASLWLMKDEWNFRGAKYVTARLMDLARH
jgi:hypothetical protein